MPPKSHQRKSSRRERKRRSDFGEGDHSGSVSTRDHNNRGHGHRNQQSHHHEGLGNYSHRRRTHNTTQHWPEENDTDIDIPGFYYDKEKKKYFKIMPNHSTISGQITKDVIKTNIVEKQRQSDLNNFKMQKALHMSSSRQISLSLQSCNLYHVLSSCQLGFRTPASARTSVQKSVIRSFEPKASESLIGTGSGESSNDVEDIKFMLMSPDARTVLGVWTRQGILGHHIHHTHVEPVTKTKVDGAIQLKLSNKRFIGTFGQNSITSVCWAPASAEDENCSQILLTASSFIGNRNSFVKIWDYVAGRDDYFDIGQQALWSSAWGGQSNHFSVGTSAASLVIELTTRRMWELYSNKSSVHAQVFSKTGQQLYSGNKRGQVFVHDLRSRSTLPVTTLKHHIKIAHLYPTQDGNSLIVSDVAGKLKKWDLRKEAVVQKFQGHVNHYVQQPFHVDSHEKILYAVGEDCYTRLWCYKTGELLKTIPTPCRVSVESIPMVAYSDNLGGPGGLPGLLTAVRGTFHIYTL